MNLQKFIAHSGFCSRRKAEDLIRDGKVAIDGKKAEIGMQVKENDKVEIAGKILHLRQEKIYLKLNKPIGYTCTNRKFPGEINIFELLKRPVSSKNALVEGNLIDFSLQQERLSIVGRLDKNSRGLVILTNDGDLAQKLTHPRFENKKKYIVIMKRRAQVIMKRDEAVISRQEIGGILKRFKEGIDIGQGDGIVNVRDIKFLGKNSFLIILTYGKKRQIRRMFTELGYEVTDLLRTGIGNVELGNLKEGEWEYIKEEELKL